MPTATPPPDRAHVSALAPTPVYCVGREPLFVSALAFSAGITADNFAWRAPPVWLIAFLLSSIGVCSFDRRAPSLAFSIALVALILLGGLYLQLSDAAQATPPILEAFGRGEGTVAMTADVMREGMVRERPFGEKQESVEFDTEELSTGSTFWPRRS